MRSAFLLSVCLVSFTALAFPQGRPDFRKGFEIAWDFGGMYGFGMVNGQRINYPNPATGTTSCPAGYADTQEFGTTNLDWPVHFCYRPHQRGATGALEFGGMFGYGVQGPYPNPLTGTTSCPAGFSAAQLLGTINTDYPL